MNYVANPITSFLVDHMVGVYFFYGLAFFVLGVVLALASRRDSELPLVRALLPLALFGLIHGAHEWVEMFQIIGLKAGTHVPGLAEEVVRTLALVSSFICLLAFGALLTASDTRRRTVVIAAPVVIWLTLLVVSVTLLDPTPMQSVYIADVLSRYTIAIPASILGAWHLMKQQREFRERDLPQFGRDLVWAAAALILYGVVGQLFVRQTAIFPSSIVNGTLFLDWFGIPIQLFRGTMAAMLLFFTVRALRAFEEESRRRLEQATRSRIEAQGQALEAERAAGRVSETLHTRLQATAKELALLLELSNILAGTAELPQRLNDVLRQVVTNLTFSDAGLIVMPETAAEGCTLAASTGFATLDTSVPGARFGPCFSLGCHAIATGAAVCRHADGAVIEFSVDAVLVGEECWNYKSPTLALALPLHAQRRTIGAIVFARSRGEQRSLSLDELHLIVAIARQIERSLETAYLYTEAQEREVMLAELLHQIVDAQESERQRIARELHDATGQSLSAIALGLRGLSERVSDSNPALAQTADSLQRFSTDALGELRRLIADLRPPQLDDLGLVAALRWYAREAQQRHPELTVTFSAEGDFSGLPLHHQTVAFRVAQEALTNSVKHAQATRVSVSLQRQADTVVLTIQDNGIGFDTTQALSRRGHAASWGLLGIRERALLLGGTYEIRSAPGQGTLIRIHAPVPGGGEMLPSQEDLTQIVPT